MTNPIVVTTGGHVAALPLCLRIGLVMIGRKGVPSRIGSLKAMARKLNAKQGAEGKRAFEFVALDGFLHNAAPLLGKHTVDTRTYFDKLVTRKRDEGRLRGLIGITSDELRDAPFNTHDASQHVGIVTIRGMIEVCPRGMDSTKYLGYLVLCEAFCVAGGKDFETPDHAGCLFDQCEDKDTLRFCLEKPMIYDENAQKLLDNGFQQAHLDAAAALLGKYIGKRPWILRAPKAIIAWALGVATGVVAHVLAILWLQLSSGWQKGIGVAMLVFMILLGFLLRHYPDDSGSIVGGY